MAYQHEKTFAQELLLVLILLPLIVILNSALQAVVDRFGGEFRALSDRARDMGLAVVFCHRTDAGHLDPGSVFLSVCL